MSVCPPVGWLVGQSVSGSVSWSVGQLDGRSVGGKRLDGKQLLSRIPACTMFHASFLSLK